MARKILAFLCVTIAVAIILWGTTVASIDHSRVTLWYLLGFWAFIMMAALVWFAVREDKDNKL